MKYRVMMVAACAVLAACDSDEGPGACGPSGGVVVEVRQPDLQGGYRPAPGVAVDLLPNETNSCDSPQVAVTDASGTATLSGRITAGWKLRVHTPDSLMIAAGGVNPMAVSLASVPAAVQVTLHYAPRDTVMMFYVHSQRAACVGAGPQSCLQVKTRPQDPYQLFYDGIEGFTFEAGFEYVLRVTRRRVPWPLADQGIYSYHLVETVSRSNTASTAPSAIMSAMLAQVPAQITYALNYNQQLLPLNPQMVGQVQAKAAILSRASLATDIVASRYYAETTATSVDARVIPIITVFTADSMRTAATNAIDNLKAALPVLEAFMQMPFQVPSIRMWYGFTLGNSGGGGVLNMEDRGTYEGRTPATRLDFDAILFHELAHSYISNESLTQFLELYMYNVWRWGSTNSQNWTFTRNWTPRSATNRGVHALLDIYEMIGRDAMSNAYKAIYPLRPPYGVAVSPQVQQAFVSNAPALVRDAVAAKAAMIGQ